jgi:hypothetical protein
MQIHSFSRHVMASMAALVLTVPSAAAQERVSTRLVPRPDQTVHTEVRQQMDTDAGNATTPLAIHVEMTSNLTMQVGAADANGNVPATVTLDSSNAMATMNGSPLPLPLPLAPGQSATVTFMKDGTVNVSGADGNQALIAIIRTVYDMGTGGGQEQLIGIGDTVKRPIATAVPVPGVPAGSATGEMEQKLVAVSREGDERIARFEQALKSEMNAGASGGPQGPLAIQGTGTAEWNLDRGIARSSQMNMTFEITTALAGTPMNLKGTVVSSTKSSY